MSDEPSTLARLQEWLVAKKGIDRRRRASINYYRPTKDTPGFHKVILYEVDERFRIYAEAEAGRGEGPDLDESIQTALKAAGEELDDRFFPRGLRVPGKLF